jgi:penicillin-binding protein 1A
MTADNTYRGPSSYTFPHCSGNGCTVHNVESGGYGTLSLRQATAYSVNTVFAQVIQDVGVKKVAEMAHRVGITMVDPDGKQPNGEPYGPSLTLGAAEVSPLDMAAAYGVFAARGMQFSATPVVRVTDPQGKVLQENHARTGKRVLNQNVADQVNDVLKDVIGYGTGKAADLGRPNGTAGKTGTAENYSDAWFVGYTPTLSTSVWMGYADGQRPLVNIKGLGQVFGGTIPAKTWHDYMAAALDGTPPADFAVPAKPEPPSTLVAPAQAVNTPAAPSPAPPVSEPYVPPYQPPANIGQTPPYGGDLPPGTPFYPPAPPPTVYVPPPPSGGGRSGLLGGLLR